MQDKQSAEELHRRQIVGARRRNNIFGETTDYIMMGFLARGGDGGIYNPDESADSPTIFGRSARKLYVIKVLYRDGKTMPALSITATDKMLAISSAMNAQPILGVANMYSRKVKFFDLGGSKFNAF
jgi:hypothetical protein